LENFVEKGLEENEGADVIIAAISLVATRSRILPAAPQTSYPQLHDTLYPVAKECEVHEEQFSLPIESERERHRRVYLISILCLSYGIRHYPEMAST
jgi:hypothetical protein